MVDANANQDRDLPAGGFSEWITEMRGALRGNHPSVVPCGSCTACCTSSQFIHIAPDERDTLAHIPKQLLFPAPRMPRGHVLLGYDERGHCPMLIDDKCSIYDHRPRTCRTYDCRIFPATGLRVDDDDKELIAQRAQQWRFSYPTPADRIEHDGARAAATYLRDHPDVFADGTAPVNATQLAVAAVELHDLFIGRAAGVDPQEVRIEISRRRGSDRPR